MMQSQITPDENDGTFSCLEQNNAMAAACKKSQLDLRE
jgi:hypothetical protein